jgi:hypothetical protein
MTSSAPDLVLSVHVGTPDVGSVRLTWPLDRSDLVAELAELLASSGHPELSQLGPCLADALRWFATVHGPDAMRPRPVVIG